MLRIQKAPDLEKLTQFLCLDSSVDYYAQFQQFRKMLKSKPIDLFMNCDKREKGSVPISQLLREVAKEVGGNQPQFWLRLLDIRKTGTIDNFMFVYSLLNDADLNAFVASQKERAKLIRVSFDNHELEILTLLALRMKSFNMRPSDWYKMIAK